MEEMCKTFQAEDLSVQVNKKQFLYTEKKAKKQRHGVSSVLRKGWAAELRPVLLEADSRYEKHGGSTVVRIGIGN